MQAGILPALATKRSAKVLHPDGLFATVALAQRSKAPHLRPTGCLESRFLLWRFPGRCRYALFSIDEHFAEVTVFVFRLAHDYTQKANIACAGVGLLTPRYDLPCRTVYRKASTA